MTMRMEHVIKLDGLIEGTIDRWVDATDDGEPDGSLEGSMLGKRDGLSPQFPNAMFVHFQCQCWKDHVPNFDL